MKFIKSDIEDNIDSKRNYEIILIGIISAVAVFFYWLIIEFWEFIHYHPLLFGMIGLLGLFLSIRIILFSKQDGDKYS